VGNGLISPLIEEFKMKEESLVLGMKANKGTMDNGSAYDSTHVYVQTKLDESRGNAKGFAVADYTFGLSENFEPFKKQTFPFMATLTFEIVTTGKTQKMQLVSVVPIPQIKGS
jgi:hypothetical protein